MLITGGTGGLGALLARHLVAEHGVAQPAARQPPGPAGRRAPASSRRSSRTLGAEVRVRACDVTDREQVQALLAEVPREHPLSAVVHAAGVLDDGVIDALSRERLERVLAPKVDGAWHLHELTAGAGPAGVRAVLLGRRHVRRPGQANYAAANAFLDALAAHRRAQGLPARLDGVGAVGAGDAR